MKKLEIAVIALIFTAALIIRLLPALTHDHPIGVDSYYHIRIAKEIQKLQSIPLYDNLSFGGRNHEYPPGTHLTLAILSSVSEMPVEVMAEIVPTIVGAFGVVILFLITRKLFGFHAGFLAASIFAFVPVYIWKTASNSLVTAFDITFLLAAAYFLERKESTHYFVMCMVISVFSPLTGLFALCMGLIATDRMKVKLCSIIGIILLSIFIYTFYISGSSIYLTKELPPDIYNAIYENIGITDFLFRLNPFVVLFSVASLILLYKQKKLKTVNLYLLWAAFAFLLLIGRLLETDRALIYLLIPLAIISGFSIKKYFDFKKTLTLILALFIIAASAFLGYKSLESLEWSAISDDTYNALLWIKQNTPKNLTVLSSLIEGHWVSEIAERRNVMDAQIIGIKDLKQRYEDVKIIYSTENQTLMKGLLAKYNVTYVLGEGLPLKKVFTSGRISVFEI